jgi:hypothetical protein
LSAQLYGRIAEYFNEASQTLESFSDRFIYNKLYDTNKMPNVTAAGNDEEATGSSHIAPSTVSRNHHTANQASFKEAGSRDAASTNEDGLYNESMPDSRREFDEEADEGEDVAAAAEDKVHSWRINHSSGDHKLRCRFMPATFDLATNLG